MKLNTATCGHKIEDGIFCSIDDGQMSWDGNRCVTFGTYCADCLFAYYADGIIENEELKKFARLLEGGNKIEKLKVENSKLKDCLKEIANEDYRGNRSNSSVKAYLCLKELEEK